MFNGMMQLPANPDRIDNPFISALDKIDMHMAKFFVVAAQRESSVLGARKRGKRTWEDEDGASHL
jgi:hypothetical protein